MSSSRRRRRRIVVPLAVLAVLAVGGGAVAAGVRGADGGADQTRRPQVTEVDLRAPTRLPAPKPEASEPTEAGATAFALFWFDTLNYSLDRLDTEALASHTGAGCTQCNGWLVAISKWQAGGADLEGGLTVPLNLAIGPFSTTEPIQFAADYLTTPATVVDGTGNAVDYPGGRTRGGLSVLWANGRWQMTDVVLDVRQAGPRP